MLLEKLSEESERLGVAPTMYEKVPIRWFIDLDPTGKLLGFVPLTNEVEGGRRSGRDRGMRIAVPDIVRASAIRPKLLADNGEYVLGIARDTTKQKRVDEAHAQFRKLVEECAQKTDESSVWAVHKFLQSWSPADHDRLPENFDPSDNLTFRVGENRPVDLPSVRAFWAHTTAAAVDKPIMECMVCGEEKEVEANLPVKIKGIPEGQPAGTALVSANTNAFESYGLKRSLNSPICRDCGERFGKAANALISDEDSRLFVGPSVYIFWSRGESSFSPVPLLRAPDPDGVASLSLDVEAMQRAIQRSVAARQSSAAVKQVLQSPISGQAHKLGLVDSEAFYATGLSASGGRVVVRDWLETSVAGAKANLARWFAWQRLADRTSDEGTPYGVFALAASLYRDARDIPSQIPVMLIQTALQGGKLPDSLLALAVRRNRADQGITRSRATLIKMVFTSQGGDPVDDRLVALNRNHPEPAYHCGRLLAQLEDVQKKAIPGIKATITDRYFGSASSAPESVFGVLIRNAQPHLSKLRKDNSRRGTFEALQREIGQILARIEDKLPTTLDFRGQALFALGYYHQRESNIGAAIAYSKTKKPSKDRDDHQHDKEDGQ